MNDSYPSSHVTSTSKSTGGSSPWRFLQQNLSDHKLDELEHREFTESLWAELDPISRRRFLTLMGASLALAGTAG
jgi:molybdopterin-containing oxidoreductase family iron-sulfur binding subunit